MYSEESYFLLRRRKPHDRSREQKAKYEIRPTYIQQNRTTIIKNVGLTPIYSIRRRTHRHDDSNREKKAEYESRYNTSTSGTKNVRKVRFILQNRHRPITHTQIFNTGESRDAIILECLVSS